MARKSQERTQDIPNIYKMSGRKNADSVRRRHAPAQNSGYKTGDTKRKNHAISRKKRRRIIRGSLFIFFVVAVLFSVVLALSQVFCKVDTVSVEYTNKPHSSKRYYTDKEVVLNTAIEKGDNLLFVSSSDIEKKIESKLPYISSAVVKKDFPSGVVIELTECKKVYAYKAETGCYLVDETGKFLELVSEKKAEKYPLIMCSEVTAEKIGEEIRIGKQSEETKEWKDTETVLDYLELLRKSGMKITKVNFTDLNDVYMTYDNRIEIHMGKMSDESNGVTAWKKIQLAKKSLDAEDKENPEQKGTLNMTISKKAYFKAETDVIPQEETTQK